MGSDDVVARTVGEAITAMLAVSDTRAATEFYRAALGADVLWDLDGAIAGLSVGGPRLFLAEESPEYGTRGPASVGFTTVRIELFLDDPVAVHKRAVAAGAIERSPVREHQQATRGPQPIKRMLQGAVVDPFGHIWLVKILGEWRALVRRGGGHEPLANAAGTAWAPL